MERIVGNTPGESLGVTMHHTKDKGDIGLAKAIADITQQGWIVCLPFTEHAAFDLIAYKDNVCKRVQVKYRALKGDTLEYQLRSSWSDKHGVHTKFIDKSSIDIFCFYCPNTDACYYVVPPKDTSTIILRKTKSKRSKSLLLEQCSRL